MQKLQLFIIENNVEQRVDLFKDEKVSLTQTIQNVKDIKKIFTEFSKTFAIPASKVNNKIFKHYYNFNISNGYDARIKVQARIYLNNIPFKEGTVKLTSVKLKKNVPHTYNITFFGNTVNLVDLLGDMQLDALQDLNKYSLNYDKQTVYDYIRDFGRGGAPTAGGLYNICVPLISHTDRMFYNSSVTNQPGNVYVGNPSNGNGIKWTNFKFAIRLKAIMDSIQAQVYTGGQTITFSDDFFNDDTNLQFYNLFMWLHRKKGGLDADNQLQTSSSALDDLAFVSCVGSCFQGSMVVVFNGTLRLSNYFINPFISLLQLDLAPTNSVSYTVRIISNIQGEIFNFTGSGTQTIVIPNALQYNYNTLTVIFETNSILTFPIGGVTWTVTQGGTTFFPVSGPAVITGTSTISNASVYATTLDVPFVMNQQIPEIKIIDFLTALFKMFNLTAYVNNVGTIVVQKLDDYYALGQANPAKVFDKYVDTTKSEVALALPFRDIQYAYEGLDTFLAKQFNQINNAQWGSLSYSLNNTTYDALTESYTITIPFEHMMFERLYDAANSSSTTIQWGWFVDDNQESYLGKPLIFYPIKVGGSGANNIQLLETDGGNFNTTNTYIIPSNAQTIMTPSTTGGSPNNIHFQAEINEWWANEAGSAGSDYTGTLFNNFYTTYITDVFNSQRRLTKLDLTIPLGEFFNLELYDIISINQNTYKINSITTDLQSGKSKVELLNSVV